MHGTDRRRARRVLPIAVGLLLCVIGARYADTAQAGSGDLAGRTATAGSAVHRAEFVVDKPVANVAKWMPGLALGVAVAVAAALMLWSAAARQVHTVSPSMVPLSWNRRGPPTSSAL
jgi:hypothetical protein